jgi:DNA-binding NtrC family response regulator
MKRILIIDDNAEFVDLLQLSLSSNYRCHTCKNLNQLDKLDDTRVFDVIIIDYHIGNSTANDYLPYMRKKFDLNKTKLILITGSIKIEQIKEEIEHDALLEKPFKISELKNKLKELMPA